MMGSPTDPSSSTYMCVLEPSLPYSEHVVSLMQRRPEFTQPALRLLRAKRSARICIELAYPSTSTSASATCVCVMYCRTPTPPWPGQHYTAELVTTTNCKDRHPCELCNIIQKSKTGGQNLKQPGGAALQPTSVVVPHRKGYTYPGLISLHPWSLFFVDNTNHRQHGTGAPTSTIHREPVAVRWQIALSSRVCRRQD